MTALVWALAARVLGPSDAWDQRQPATMAYTTDILVNGNWILPREHGERRATKPPLYNWLAVPAVKLAGFSSELAHKVPSVIALCLCWLTVVLVGRKLDADHGAAVGALGGLFVAANYLCFKLGYLARPDMVLTLWLLLGWLAATVLLAQQPSAISHQPSEATPPVPGASLSAKRWLAFAFWVCAAAAALTKGPAVLPLLVYAVLAARLIGGRWRAVHALQWWWGAPLSLLIVGAWIYAAWRIDARHVQTVLWSHEIVGRITGLGPEGTGRGPAGMLTTAHYMIAYYLVRFVPWSVLSIAAMFALWRREHPGAPRRWRTLSASGVILHGAALFVLVTIALYSFSAGKRADYIAAALPPGALLAAWWLLCAPPRLGHKAPWLAPAAAAVVLAAMTGYNSWQPQAPRRDFGAVITRFIQQSEARLRAEPRPVAWWAIGDTHLLAFLGIITEGGSASVQQKFAEGEPFWLLLGRPPDPPHMLAEVLTESYPQWSLTEVCRSGHLGRTGARPEEVILYRVDPR
ncbi:MAG: ArnT family glycosyltransferase [Planctomycetota bacterium]